MIDFPYMVGSSVLLINSIAPTDTRGFGLGTMAHLRVEDIADNFANMVRASGKDQSIVV